MQHSLTGKKAAPGTAVGRPVIVHSEADLAKVQPGDILVAAQTDIDYVPAMQRAAAIVTETGGRFCHAAVWARENNKPTLLQVADATTLLVDVESVTIDASANRIIWEDSK
ncbi:MAG: PEP-utilizing enzyme [Actinomycetota bacterium]